MSTIAPPPGGLFSWTVQINYLINFAYDLRGAVRQGSWTGLPKWARDQSYTIEARAEGHPSRADVREMVKSLLEERFQFAGHMEKREGEVLAPEVAKPGLGLKPHPEDAPCILSSSMTDENKYPQAYPPYRQVPVHCGIFNRELSHSGERRLEMLDVTLQQIGDSFWWEQLSVVDHTGIKGRYDAVLDYGPGGIPQNPNPSDELGLPPFPVALQKQLGLKLEKQKAQIDVFIIDHIDTPSEN